MTAYVFLGPSLSLAQARETLDDAVFLPPVAQGDVYQVALRRPSLIGIVDGYFDRVPAVWHKEILWALNQGIPVLGAASMGALRAAELDVFGMEGVGRVYAAFCDGALEGDDEVAVAHGLAEDGHRALSEAMVSIRATLDDAAAAGVVGDDTRKLVVDAAKSMFYADRSYQAALATAAEAGADPDELQRLRRWVAEAAVDQKQRDALELVARLRQRLAEGATTVTTSFTFKYTDFWFEAQRSIGELGDGQPAETDGDAGAGRATREALLDELRLDPERYQRVWETTFVRLNTIDHAQIEGYEVTDARRQATAEQFRRERGLYDPEDARRWMADNDLTRQQCALLMGQEAQVRWAQSISSLPVADRMPDQLRVDGDYPELVARARHKARALEAAGYRDVSLADLGVEWDDVLAWYFHQRLGTAVPADVAAFATAHGFSDQAHFPACAGARVRLRHRARSRRAAGRGDPAQRRGLSRGGVIADPAGPGPPTGGAARPVTTRGAVPSGTREAGSLRLRVTDEKEWPWLIPSRRCCVMRTAPCTSSRARSFKTFSCRMSKPGRSSRT
jgi:hypothetical protein